MIHFDQNHHYELTLAGVSLSCGFSFPETPLYFGSCLTGPFDGPADIVVDEQARLQWVAHISEWNAVAEFSSMSFAVSDVLMQQNRFLFHSVAVSYQGRAYLIAGLPGVGKSTQAEFLRAEHPGEFAYISGDRPVLEQLPDGGFLVHPSPWNGKERRFGAEAASLAGVVFLSRGEKNEIVSIEPRDAAIPAFTAILQKADSVERLHTVANYADALLRAVPIWQMTSFEVPDSTRLLYQTVFAEGEKL